ncbi:MAG: MFS transporter [Alphaproteobacteria bacterium]
MGDRTRAREAKREERRVVALVCGGHFFSHFYLLGLAPLFPIMKGELGLSYTELGGLVTAFSIASGVAQYPIGILVDRYGPRFILAGGLALLAASFAGIGLASGYAPLLALAFCAGLGNAVFHPANSSILGATVSPGRLGRAFAVHTFFGHLGWAAAPPSMVFLTALWDWRAALVVSGALGLVMALILLVQGHRLRGEQAPPHGAAVPGEAPKAVGTVQLLSAPPILMMFVFYVMTAGVMVGMPAFTPAALTTLYGTSLVDANAALTAFLVAGAGGVLVGGIAADRIGRLDAIAGAGFLTAALAMSLVASVDLPVVALALVFALAGFMLGMISPSRDLMVRAVTPPGASGKVFGFVSVGLDVGAAIAPLGFGWLIDRGQPGAVFLAAAGLMIVSLLAAMAAARFAPKAAAAPAE